MKHNFNQKVVVITGSSMGIGKSLAILLGMQKARLVINGRNAEKLLATEKELKKLGCEIISFAGDIARADVCRNLINYTLEHFNRIDVLVNNAGVSMRGAIEHLSPELISNVYQINAVAPVMLTQMALPHIKKTSGSIVFISSLAGLRGLPLISVYSSAKMSLTSIAQSLRAEHYADNIHIGLIHVGYTEVEQGKTTLDANCNPVILNERKGIFVATTDEVAIKIAKNISSRKKKTIIGIQGKFFGFLVQYFPGLIEMLVIRAQKKSAQLYK